MGLDKIMNLESALNCATKQNHEQRVINKKLYYENIDLKKQLKLLRVSRNNVIDYAKGFELAMDFIDKHPADPDITDEQVRAWIKLQDFLNKSDCKK